MRNVHERVIQAGAAEAGALIDGLAGDDDRLWPHERWPAIRFDGGLHVGARGGHGPIRYTVEELVPGELAVFRFRPRDGFDGTHRFELEPRDGGVVLRHVLAGRTRGRMIIGWPLAFRWLHDACVEDALDKAERELAGARRPPRPLGRWVRLLRRIGARRRRRRP
jgi:hypothetical protein